MDGYGFLLSVATFCVVGVLIAAQFNDDDHLNWF